MIKKKELPRRDFLKQAAATVGAATQMNGWPTLAQEQSADRPSTDDHKFENVREISFPRVYRGSALKMLSFPLGGVAAGSLGLGG